MHSDTGFDEIEEKIQRSKLSQKSKLDIVIFGPYEGVCSAILLEIERQLQKEEYNAKTCLNVQDPTFPSRLTVDEKNWLRSEKCLKVADVAIFVFMEAVTSRNLRSGTNSYDLNSSVVQEYTYWLTSLNMSNDRTFILFEGESRKQLGSLVGGLADNQGIETADVDCEDYRSMYQEIVGQCWRWVDRHTS